MSRIVKCSKIKIQKFTWVWSKAQLVLSLLARNSKHVVLGVSSFACSVFQIYSKPALCFFRRCILSSPNQNSPFRLPKPFFYRRSNRGRNQRNRPVSSGTLSTPHRLLFGHRTHRRHLNHQGRLHKHRWLFDLICTAQHSSSWLLIKKKKRLKLTHMTKALTKPM